MNSAASLPSVVAESILKAAAPSKVQTAPWKRRLVNMSEDRACRFCLVHGDAEGVRLVNSFLLPPALGGQPFDENRIVTCMSCAKARSNRDVLSWNSFFNCGTEESRASVLQQRDAVLSTASNHLTATRVGASKAQVLACLRQRWQQPRVKLFAHHSAERGYVGWTVSGGEDQAHGEAAAILRFGFHAQPVASDTTGIVLMELAEPMFLDAVMALVENGALVEPLPLDDAVPVDPHNWQHWWRYTFHNIDDLVRRRPRLSGNNSRTKGTLAYSLARLRDRLPDDLKHLSARRMAIAAPSPPRKLSDKPSAVSERQAYRKRAEQERERQWRTARADLDAYKLSVANGSAHPATALELLEMEFHVLDLFDAIKAW
ncbi:hypothetical protein ERT44_16525 [Stenotrophomonas sp. MA5]|uniref:hypothetical protein n=1 Tax=Stenotrophomonas TaxID=40323 RepID=UPI001009B2BB|nr:MULTISPECIES: hypothetical protein [Stenotrophomonas]RXK64284.1 hypothetical protein ERT44_16525 [Stenotrophomonas sp. MA5]